MSVESLAVVLHHSQASGTDKLVLVGIANHDGDGGAWPSVPTLARYANVSDRSVQRSIEKLRATGEIIVYTSAGGTRVTPDHKRPNRYEILVECPEGCDRSRNHRIKPVDNALFAPVTLVTPGDVGVTPPGDARVTPPGDVGVTPPGDVGVTRTILRNHPGNPSLELGSPAEDQTCWSCGQVHFGSGKYCRPCTSRGMDNDMINCQGCGRVARRQVAGQQSYTCTTCKGETPWDK
ncbi:helix-turn-helix domain-containing protein [Arthrobacter sp. GMC3]|uniref:helix-turn-helix domain-containing protein n=1 Tax=Arthrobacter sp. GMC3 TaxID=2058894 RepID=UPI0015E3E8A1|nr:helix-turn-helix domain-containing protein [Arthrobacter sp. GMC3]